MTERIFSRSHRDTGLWGATGLWGYGDLSRGVHQSEQVAKQVASAQRREAGCERSNLVQRLPQNFAASWRLHLATGDVAHAYIWPVLFAIDFVCGREVHASDKQSAKQAFRA